MMEYKVVYSLRGLGGTKHKRKRYERSAQQMDGILLIRNAEGTSTTATTTTTTTSSTNVSQIISKSPMITLYKSNQFESDSEFLDAVGNDEGEQFVDVVVDGSDDDYAMSTNKKMGSWKDRQKYRSRQKPKGSTKKCRSNNHQTTKTVVYSGIVPVTRFQNATNNETDGTEFPAVLSVDDILIVGQYEVQILEVPDGTTGTCSSKENCMYRLLSTLQQQSDNTIPNIHQITSMPVRKIVSVPLQSKHNIRNDSNHQPTTGTTSSSGGIMKNIGKKLHTPLFPGNTENTKANAGTQRTAFLSKQHVSSSLPKYPVAKKATALLSLSVSIKPESVDSNIPGIDKNIPKILAHIPLPASIRTTLRPHQVDGVDFIWRALTKQKGCILGDEMGLGKTLMTIACISAIHRTNREKQFVVVCPSSLVVNWSNEFDKWLGPASQPKRVVIHEGGTDGLQQIRAYMQKTKQQIKHQPGQVLIISYDLFRRNVNIFDRSGYVSVGLLVVDEGHRLKNAGDSRTFIALASLPTDARLCITATPIQNNLCEFFNLAEFCCPGILGPDISHFRKHFERPITKANQKNATRQELEEGLAKSKELDLIANTFMIRRLQKDVIKTMLPPRTEAFLFCRPTKIQCQLYRDVCTGNSTSLGSISAALTTLVTLRKICAHPSLHKPIEQTDTKYIPYTLNSSQVAMSGKIIVLSAILKEIRHNAVDDKVVIVSNFTSVLSLVENLILHPHAYSYLRLDGTTKDRQALIDTFNRTSVARSFCLLLSSKAGGCGLNIVGANRLILLDADWNPATCQQAMGRIYRQGQTKACTIYRLFTSGTVEEVILQRQMQKGGLSALTVDAGNSRRTSLLSNENSAKFSKEELKECFNLKENIACDTKVKLGSNWPTYDPSSLLSLGCNDVPLAAVAAKFPETLCFIHINNDRESVPDEDTAGNEAGHLKYYSEVGSESEDEEQEFTM